MPRSLKPARLRDRDVRGSVCAWCEQAIPEGREVLGFGTSAVPGVDLQRQVTIVGHDFGEFFRTATGFLPPAPYDYQRRLAGDLTVDGAVVDRPKLLAINMPTGAGKWAVSPANQSRSVR